MVDAREYHDRTNHSPARLRRDDFSLDYATKPRPYKIYEGLSRISTAGTPDPPDEPVLSAIATAAAAPGDVNDPAPIDAGSVLTLCHYATGVTKELEIQGRRMRFRAASCTGKLYHVDLYAVAGELDGLEAGIYHFDPDSGSFDVLREGDHRGVLAEASGNRAGVANAPVTFVATSQWWRNAWKYRDRTCDPSQLTLRVASDSSR